MQPDRQPHPAAGRPRSVPPQRVGALRPLRALPPDGSAHQTAREPPRGGAWREQRSRRRHTRRGLWMGLLSGCLALFRAGGCPLVPDERSAEGAEAGPESWTSLGCGYVMWPGSPLPRPIGALQTSSRRSKPQAGRRAPWLRRRHNPSSPPPRLVAPPLASLPPPTSRPAQVSCSEARALTHERLQLAGHLLLHKQ